MRSVLQALIPTTTGEVRDAREARKRQVLVENQPESRRHAMHCDQINPRRSTWSATFQGKSQSLTFWRSTLLGLRMKTRHQSPAMPREVIVLTTYAQLNLYLGKFSAGELGLVLLLGRHGTGKSESVKRALSVSDTPSPVSENAANTPLYIEGHMQPFGLYRQLWNNRDQAIVLDDLDRLYADSDCVRLLKPRPMRPPWRSVATRNRRCAWRGCWFPLR